jgi:hypothetical protein
MNAEMDVGILNDYNFTVRHSYLSYKIQSKCIGSKFVETSKVIINVTSSD